MFAYEDSDKVDGYCFSCSTYVRHPYGEEKQKGEVELPKQKTPQEIEEELREVLTLESHDIRSRRLRGEYLQRFGVKVAYSEEDGKTLDKMYFPIHKKGEVTGYYVKTLTLDKNITWAIGDVKNGEPFGWDRAKRTGAYRLIITEGKEDAIAVESIMDRLGKADYMPAVISLSNGVDSVDKNLSLIADEASRIFREIIICFDDDEPGHNAVKKAMQYFPDALSVTLPEKDANDCLVKGSQKAAYNALSFSATKPKNSRLVFADESLHAAAREPTPWGQLTWPYPSLNDMLRGIRYGETIYMGAGVSLAPFSGNTV